MSFFLFVYVIYLTILPLPQWPFPVSRICYLHGTSNKDTCFRGEKNKKQRSYQRAGLATQHIGWCMSHSRQTAWNSMKLGARRLTLLHRGLDLHHPGGKKKIASQRRLFKEEWKHLTHWKNILTPSTKNFKSFRS